MGVIITIDGVDSSGKGLQSRMLFEKLTSLGKKVTKVSFPDYDSDSSAPVRMYLSGKLGKSVDSVNAYAASLFFAVDRYISYKQSWIENYNAGEIVICDRYVSSNAIHQSVKLPCENRDEFLAWIDEVEYDRMGLPRPDVVLFLDVPVDVAMKLMSGRYDGDETKKDIHEADIEYLKKCHNAAEYACDKFGWQRIECVTDGVLRTPEDIHEEIMSIIKKYI